MISVCSMRRNVTVCSTEQRYCAPHFARRRDQSSTFKSLNRAKSRTFAVTKIRSCTRAMAAICPSTYGPDRLSSPRLQTCTTVRRFVPNYRRDRTLVTPLRQPAQHVPIRPGRDQ